MVKHVSVGLTLLRKLQHAENLITTRTLLFCATFKGQRPGFVVVVFSCYVQIIELEMILR